MTLHSIANGAPLDIWPAIKACLLKKGELTIDDMHNRLRTVHGIEVSRNHVQQQVAAWAKGRTRVQKDGNRDTSIYRLRQELEMIGCSK